MGGEDEEMTALLGVVVASPVVVVGAEYALPKKEELSEMGTLG